MREENLSFPNKDDPTSPFNNPPIDMDTPITELHHGKWWTHSWKRKCVPGGNKVYVPLIFYMDGICLDQNGSITLTPLNVTLGIFNTKLEKNLKLGKHYIFSQMHPMRIHFNQETQLQWNQFKTYIIV